MNTAGWYSRIFHVHPEPKIQAGDIIKVTVDTDNTNISWVINSKTEISYSCPLLSKNVKWAPMCWFFHTGDEI